MGKPDNSADPAGDAPATAQPQVRLFFALWPDDRVRGTLAGWTRQLHDVAGGRATRSANLHLTLVFLGNVASARVDEIKSLAATVSVPAFRLDFSRTGFWSHNRIAWAAPDSCPAALAELVRQLESMLESAGFRFDRRPYAPHVTLVRNARDTRTACLVKPFAWDVQDFTLVQSVPTGAGSEYRVIGRWRLPG